MSKVDEAIVEIDAALVEMAPEHEGLRDYALLDITDETRAQVTAAIAQYDRRKLLLDTARAANAALVADTYPTLVIPDVSMSVLADLQANAATIEAALAQFKADPAVRLSMTAGEPEHK